MSRAEKVEVARRLRRQGMALLAIASELGVSRSSVSSYLTDPDLDKQRERRKRYGRPCLDCGALTTGSLGRARAPRRCADCETRRAKAEKQWTRDAVIAAIQRWAAEHGGIPPSASDFRLATRGYPSSGSVYQGNCYCHRNAPFAKWADAVEAAGFPRPHVGRPKARAAA